jgi:hypothetical protein
MLLLCVYELGTPSLWWPGDGSLDMEYIPLDTRHASLVHLLASNTKSICLAKATASAAIYMSDTNNHYNGYYLPRQSVFSLQANKCGFSKDLEKIASRYLFKYWRPSSSSPAIPIYSTVDPSKPKRIVSNKKKAKQIWTNASEGHIKFAYGSPAASSFTRSVKDIRTARVTLCCPYALKHMDTILQSKHVYVTACEWLPSRPIHMYTNITDCVRPESSLVPALYLTTDTTDGRKYLASLFRTLTAPNKSGAVCVNRLDKDVSHYACGFIHLDSASYPTSWNSRPCESVDCHNMAGKKTCGRCRLVVYCSVACQKHHWNSHKLACIPSTV